MTRESWIALYRVGFSALALVAIGYQFADGRGNNPDFRTVNFFSFFTIQSNLYAVAILLLAVLIDRRGRPSPTFDLFRGAAVLYMVTTGIVYGLLLSGYQEELQTTLPWVDTVVHRVMPIVLVADWLIGPPRTAIDVRRAAKWLIYPLVYVTYSLIRGPVVDWYPYPFLDPDEAGGYGGVLLYCVAIALGIGLFATVVAWTSRRGLPRAAPA